MSEPQRHVQRWAGVPGSAETAVFFTQESGNDSRKQRRFSEKDLTLSLLQAILGLAAATTPPSFWAQVCRVTAWPKTLKGRRRELAGFSARVGDVLRRSDIDAAQLFARTQQRLHERQMTYLRERFSQHQPVTDVEGLEHLQASLAQGKGVILWNTPALSDVVVTKRALAAAGHAAHQLSVRSHGFSQSKFAVRHLNPGQIAVEDRYLAGRIWFEGADAMSATREVMRRLQKNLPVLFTNSLFAGRSFVGVPVGDAFVLTMPTTPLSIAAKAGVPLHVVTTVEHASFSHYVTHISPALSVGDIALPGMTMDARLAALALQARDILVPLLRQYPDQIRLWDRLVDTAEFADGRADDGGASRT